MLWSTVMLVFTRIEGGIVVASDDVAVLFGCGDDSCIGGESRFGLRCLGRHLMVRRLCIAASFATRGLGIFAGLPFVVVSFGVAAFLGPDAGFYVTTCLWGRYDVAMVLFLGSILSASDV